MLPNPANVPAVVPSRPATDTLRLLFLGRLGERYELDGVPVIPLPHPSGASSWPNFPANRARLDAALSLVKDELQRL